MYQCCVYLTGKLGQLALLVTQHLAEILTRKFQMHRIAQTASMVSTQMVHDVVFATGDNRSIVCFLFHEIAAPFANNDSDHSFHLCKDVTVS